MQMTGSSGLFSVPSEHLPGLIALVVFPLAGWLAIAGGRALADRGHPRAVGLLRRYDTLPVAGRLALFAMGVAVVVHAAIVPTHWADARVTAVFFIVDTVGFAVAGVWTMLHGRLWRLGAFGMLAGTASGYVLYLLLHWETADIVGVATSAIELGAALVLLASDRADSSVPASNPRWTAAWAMPLAFFTLLSAAAIADTGQASATPVATHAGASGPARSPGASVPSGRDGMAMGVSPSATTESLPTSSAAGDVVWPQPSGSMPAGMEMVPANCTQAPTPAQSKAAVALVDATVAATKPYQSLAAAKAAGFVPVTRTGAKIVHYLNYSVAEHSAPLDPTAIPALVYVNTLHGAVLVAAMYLMTPNAGGAPPQPGGCLTEWHVHSNLCFSGSQVAGKTASGGSCAEGTTNKMTEPMLHVWMAPVDGGPLAGDPGAVSEVTAAAALRPVGPANGVA
jgi:hypothetical protein